MVFYEELETEVSHMTETHIVLMKRNTFHICYFCSLGKCMGHGNIYLLQNIKLGR